MKAIELWDVEVRLMPSGQFTIMDECKYRSMKRNDKESVILMCWVAPKSIKA